MTDTVEPTDTADTPIVPAREKLAHYCTILYERMEVEALGNAIRADPNYETNIHIWKGRLIATCDDLGIPRGSYQRVVKALRNTQCIEQVERGFRGAALSTFILHHPPTLDVQEALRDSPGRLTGGPNYDSLRAEVQAIAKQLGGMSIPEALLEVEKRFESITARLDELEAQQHNNHNSNTTEGEK